MSWGWGFFELGGWGYTPINHNGDVFYASNFKDGHVWEPMETGPFPDDLEDLHIEHRDFPFVCRIPAQQYKL